MLSRKNYATLLLLAFAISFLITGLSPVRAQPGVTSLLSLNGNNGFRIDGENPEDSFGGLVSGGGDVNGDGIDDFAIDSFAVNNDGGLGRVYILFGNDNGFPAVSSASEIDGSIGFTINGDLENTTFANTISLAGDINGDGFADIAMGDFIADANGTASGRAAVVFGSDAGFPSSISLSELNGTNGFVIHGEFPFDLAGFDIDYVGDINGDGLDDLLIGSPNADPNANRAGRSHVIFGSPNGFPPIFDLSSINGSNGFTIDGIAFFESAGESVAGGSDINNDGIGDLLIGSPDANSQIGSCFVVFGRDDNNWPVNFQLADLDGSNGFRINGDQADSRLCINVTATEDINGDGIGEVILGATNLEPNGPGSGGLYVLFGSPQPFPAVLAVNQLDGNNGFRLDGPAGNNGIGRSFTVGDINNDNLADLIVGAPLRNNNTGQVHVIFGSRTGFPATLPLGSLDENNSLIFTGVREFDTTATSVAATSDINGDGINDLAIAATGTDNVGEQSGSLYVVYGTDIIHSGGFESAP